MIEAEAVPTPGAGEATEGGGAVQADSIVLELGAMPPGAIISKEGLAKIFARQPISIERAVKRGELPAPARLLGCERWTAGAILRHIEKKMSEAAEDAARLVQNSV